MDAKLKISFDQQLLQAVNQSQEVLQILSKLSSIKYSTSEISECFRSELESLSSQLSLVMSELREVSAKTLTLCENANSLMNSNKNIEDFNRSLERFKSLIPQPTSAGKY